MTTFDHFIRDDGGVIMFWSACAIAGALIGWVASLLW